MEDKLTVTQASVKNGLILGLISIVIGTINLMFVLYEDTTLSVVVGVISVALTVYFIVASHSLFKESNGGFMSYGQGLGIGVLISLISSVISVIFNYIYVIAVDDASVVFRTEEAIRQMDERGMSQTDIDSTMEMMSFLYTPEFTLVAGVIGGVLFGLIISLIVSAITKRTDPSLSI